VKLNETEREYKRTDHLAPDPSRRAWTEMQPVLQLVRKGRYDPSPVKERVTRLERDRVDGLSLSGGEKSEMFGSAGGAIEKERWAES
jgi:hypothetical protein